MKKAFLILAFILFTHSVLYPNNIKAIVFDFGGVVVDWDYNKSFGFLSETLNVESEKVKDLVVGEDTYALSTGTLKEQKFWEDFALHNALSLPADFQNRYSAFMETNIVTNEKLLLLIQELKSKGYETPLLSDVTEWQAHVFRNLGLYNSFNPVLLSCEIGMKKPAKTIFYYLLSTLKVEPKECLFIDDREENVLAAREVGIDAIQFTNLEALKLELKKREIDVSHEGNK